MDGLGMLAAAADSGSDLDVPVCGGPWELISTVRMLYVYVACLLY